MPVPRAASFALLLSLPVWGVAPSAETTLGPVTGKVFFNRAQAFLGIPYAADTGGSNRFQPPASRGAWTSPRQAVDWAPGCEQTETWTGPGSDVPKNQSEDCLNLNVYMPLDATPSSALPVFVFFHGGAFVEGWNDGPNHLYEPSKMVARERIVIFEPNYRLEAFGFLAVNGTTIGGNFGVMDQRFALVWIRDNAKAFGGDPTSVTIGGQSAGAMSVAIHMVSPASRGLFHRAVMNSNFAGFVYKDFEEQKALSDAFLEAVGCKADAGLMHCLQACSTEEIKTATSKAAGGIWQNLRSAVEQWSHLLTLALPWTPTVGTPDLPRQPKDVFEDGSAMYVPLLEGTVHDEGMTFIGEALGKHIGVITGVEYGGILKALFGDRAAKVQARYPSSGAFKSIANQFADILTDNWFKCSTQRLALQNAKVGQQPSFHYRYSHPINETELAAYQPALPEVCVNRSCHSSDLPALFGSLNYAVNPSPMEQRIESQLMDYWGSFIKGSVPAADGPVWPALDDDRNGLLLGDTVVVESEKDLCEFWDSIDDCWADGECAQGDRSGCCTGHAHHTGACGLQLRCGCLDDGECLDITGSPESDCCNGVAHNTLACLGGRRCGAVSFNDFTV